MSSLSTEVENVVQTSETSHAPQGPYEVLVDPVF